MLGLDEDRNEIKEAPELNEEYHEVMNTKIYTDQDREMAIKVWGWTDFVSPHTGRNSRPKIKIIIDKMSKRDHIRAACIAAWHLDFSSTVAKVIC